ncbi:MAG: PEP-CTERM sorting domain-containing protein [Verrucomicrobiales bacterium]
MKKVFLSLFCLATLASARASVLITWEQVGDDVRVAYSGSIDTDTFAIPPGSDTTESPQLNFSPETFGVLNGASSAFDVQNALTVSVWSRPFSFDSTAPGSPAILVSPGSDTFSIADNIVHLPQGYASGDPLSGSVLIYDRTLADFGAENLNNQFVWYNPNNTVSHSTIPEPASALLLALAGGSLLTRRRPLSPR